MPDKRQKLIRQVRHLAMCMSLGVVFLSTQSLLLSMQNLLGYPRLFQHFAVGLTLIELAMITLILHMIVKRNQDFAENHPFSE